MNDKNIQSQKFRKTKIIATLGPASNTVDIMVDMIHAGMNCARFNFSHGNHQEHKERYDKLHEAMEISGKKVALLLDTKGPEIRTGELEGDPVLLEETQRIIVSGKAEHTTKEVVALSYKNIHEEVPLGTTIKIADGLIALEVVSIDNTDVHCIVKKGGTVEGKKNVNLPGVKLNLPNIEAQDILDIQFAIAHNYDYIAASFTRSAETILQIQSILNQHNSSIAIIAKIENQEGLDNLESIVQVANGIMVARGDLAEQIPPEQVPLMQKYIIKDCLHNHKIAITATQILQSMETSNTPTRAELTDVANAIFDGTDAMMLSGETAKGRFPIEAITTMHKVALAVEESTQFKVHANKTFFAGDKEALIYESGSGESLITAAQLVADKIGAAALVCPSITGNTPKLVSVYRPAQPIICPTHLISVYTKLLLLWGAYPILTKQCTTEKELLDTSIQETENTKLMKKNDKIVILVGLPINKPLMLNTLQIHFHGDVIARGRQGCGPIVQGRFFKTESIQDAITHQKNAKEQYIYCIPRFTYSDLPYAKDFSALLIENPSEVPIEMIEKQFPDLAFTSHINALMFQHIANERTIVISGREKFIYEP